MQSLLHLFSTFAQTGHFYVANGSPMKLMTIDIWIFSLFSNYIFLNVILWSFRITTVKIFLIKAQNLIDSAQFINLYLVHGMSLSNGNFIIRHPYNFRSIC